MEITNLVEILQKAGLPGLIVALVILVAVFLLRRGGVVATGNQARLANVILAFILAGLNPANPEIENGMIAAIGTILSALVYELIKFIGAKTGLRRS